MYRMYSGPIFYVGLAVPSESGIANPVRSLEGRALRPGVLFVERVRREPKNSSGNGEYIEYIIGFKYPLPR